jgi:prefoldin subunit 5
MKGSIDLSLEKKIGDIEHEFKLLLEKIEEFEERILELEERLNEIDQKVDALT